MSESLLEAERRRTAETLDRLAGNRVIAYASEPLVVEGDDGPVTIETGLYVKVGGDWVMPEATAGSGASAAFARDVLAAMLAMADEAVTRSAAAHFPSLGSEALGQLARDVVGALTKIAPSLADTIAGALTPEAGGTAVDLTPAVGLNVGKLRARYASKGSTKGEALHG